jgi:hypothetical protein
MGFIWDIRDVYGMYPRCIPNSSNIPDLSRIYPGFILDDRFMRDSSAYPAYISDSKAGGYQQSGMLTL